MTRWEIPHRLLSSHFRRPSVRDDAALAQLPDDLLVIVIPNHIREGQGRSGEESDDRKILNNDLSFRTTPGRFWEEVVRNLFFIHIIPLREICRSQKTDYFCNSKI